MVNGGAGERLMELHARAAGIGEDDFDALAFEALDEDVAALHAGAEFGLRGRFRFSGFCGCFAHGYALGLAGGAWRTKNPRLRPAVGDGRKLVYARQGPAASPTTTTTANWTCPTVPNMTANLSARANGSSVD